MKFLFPFRLRFSFSHGSFLFKDAPLSSHEALSSSIEGASYEDLEKYTLPGKYDPELIKSIKALPRDPVTRPRKKIDGTDMKVRGVWEVQYADSPKALHPGTKAFYTLDESGKLYYWNGETYQDEGFLKIENGRLERNPNFSDPKEEMVAFAHQLRQPDLETKTNPSLVYEPTDTIYGKYQREALSAEIESQNSPEKNLSIEELSMMLKTEAINVYLQSSEEVQKEMLFQMGYSKKEAEQIKRRCDQYELMRSYLNLRIQTLKDLNNRLLANPKSSYVYESDSFGYRETLNQIQSYLSQNIYDSFFNILFENKPLKEIVPSENKNIFDPHDQVGQILLEDPKSDAEYLKQVEALLGELSETSWWNVFQWRDVKASPEQNIEMAIKNLAEDALEEEFLAHSENYLQEKQKENQSHQKQELEKIHKILGDPPTFKEEEITIIDTRFGQRESRKEKRWVAVKDGQRWAYQGQIFFKEDYERLAQEARETPSEGIEREEERIMESAVRTLENQLKERGQTLDKESPEYTALLYMNYLTILYKNSLKSFNPENLSPEKKAIWKIYENSTNTKNELWHISNLKMSINLILEELPFILASGAVAGAVTKVAGRVVAPRIAAWATRAEGRALAVSEVEKWSSRAVKSRFEQIMLRGATSNVASFTASTVTLGASFETAYPVLGTLAGKEVQWPQGVGGWAERIMWGSIMFGFFRGAGKLTQKITQKMTINLGTLENPQIVAKFAQNISHDGLKKAITVMSTGSVGINLEAATMLLVGAAQNGYYNGNLQEFWENLPQEVLHAYVMVGGFRVANAVKGEVRNPLAQETALVTVGQKIKLSDGSQMTVKLITPEGLVGINNGKVRFLPQRIVLPNLEKAQIERAKSPQEVLFYENQQLLRRLDNPLYTPLKEAAGIRENMGMSEKVSKLENYLLQEGLISKNNRSERAHPELREGIIAWKGREFFREMAPQNSAFLESLGITVEGFNQNPIQAVKVLQEFLLKQNLAIDSGPIAAQKPDGNVGKITRESYKYWNQTQKQGGKDFFSEMVQKGARQNKESYAEKLKKMTENIEQGLTKEQQKTLKELQKDYDAQFLQVRQFMDMATNNPKEKAFYEKVLENARTGRLNLALALKSASAQTFSQRHTLANTYLRELAGREKPLTENEFQQLDKIHQEVGIEIGKGTPEQIAEVYRRIRELGYTPKEARVLMETGIMGVKETIGTVLAVPRVILFPLTVSVYGVLFFIKQGMGKKPERVQYKKLKAKQKERAKQIEADGRVKEYTSLIKELDYLIKNINNNIQKYPELRANSWPVTNAAKNIGNTIIFRGKRYYKTKAEANKRTEEIKKEREKIDQEVEFKINQLLESIENNTGKIPSRNLKIQFYTHLQKTNYFKDQYKTEFQNLLINDIQTKIPEANLSKSKVDAFINTHKDKSLSDKVELFAKEFNITLKGESTKKESLTDFFRDYTNVEKTSDKIKNMDNLDFLQEFKNDVTSEQNIKMKIEANNGNKIYEEYIKGQNSLKKAQENFSKSKKDLIKSLNEKFKLLTPGIGMFVAWAVLMISEARRDEDQYGDVFNILNLLDWMELVAHAGGATFGNPRGLDFDSSEALDWITILTSPVANTFSFDKYGIKFIDENNPPRQRTKTETSTETEGNSQEKKQTIPDPLNPNNSNELTNTDTSYLKKPDTKNHIQKLIDIVKDPTVELTGKVQIYSTSEHKFIIIPVTEVSGDNNQGKKSNLKVHYEALKAVK